jgi:hypothetical protein
MTDRTQRGWQGDPRPNPQNVQGHLRPNPQPAGGMGHGLTKQELDELGKFTPEKRQRILDVRNRG